MTVRKPTRTGDVATTPSKRPIANDVSEEELDDELDEELTRLAEWTDDSDDEDDLDDLDADDADAPNGSPSGLVGRALELARPRGKSTPEQAIDATAAESRIGHGPIASAVRYVLNRYELAEEQPLPRSIAVVSALRGDGVTTISRALAEVLTSDFAARVCWIDFTWTAPPRRRRKAAPAPVMPGIYEVLTNAATLDEVLVEGGSPNLSVLHPGTVPDEHRSAMARWDDLQELVDRLRDDFDFLVLDVAPLLSDPDALALMRHADAQILVARHAGVSASQIRTVAKDLETIPMLGAILNEYRTHTPRLIRRFFAG